MGGRGKASGKGDRPMNFSDGTAIELEELEERDDACACIEELARRVEGAVADLLRTGSKDTRRPAEEMAAQVIAKAVQQVEGRPAEERQAFAAALAPLFEELRERASEESS